MAIHGTQGPTTSDGKSRVAVEKSDMSKAQYYSNDLTDRTTWIELSTTVVDEDLKTREIAPNDLTTFQTEFPYIIDSYHGKMTGEDFFLDSSGNSYRIDLKKNGTSLVEDDPHFLAQDPPQTKDFHLDYDTGIVTLHPAILPGDTLTITYHKAGGSQYTLKPPPGKRLLLSVVEVQFSTDIIITDSVHFQPFGYVDVFAPQYLDTATPPGIYPSGTLIPLGNPVIYKTMLDYMNDSLRAYPAYPAFGGSGWRGLSAGSLVFDWDYINSTPLSSAAGMELRIHLEHETPLDGGYATVTFYCSLEDEE